MSSFFPKYILEESNESTYSRSLDSTNVVGDELLSSDIVSKQAMYTLYMKMN